MWGGEGILYGTWGVWDPIWEQGGYGVLYGNRGGKGSWMGHGGYGVLDGKRGQNQHHGQLLEYPDGGWGG